MDEDLRRKSKGVVGENMLLDYIVYVGDTAAFISFAVWIEGIEDKSSVTSLVSGYFALLFVHSRPSIRVVVVCHALYDAASGKPSRGLGWQADELSLIVIDEISVVSIANAHIAGKWYPRG
jgi:hypothetical protein